MTESISQIAQRSWLSNLPKSWDVQPVKRLFKLTKEVSHVENPQVLSLTRSGVKERDISGNEGQIASSYLGYASVKPGDFVLNPMDLIAGWVAITPFEGVVSNAYITFRPVTKNGRIQCEPRYFEYLFGNYYQQRIFNPFGRGLGRSESGGGRWTLNSLTFLNFPIPVPPIEEQKAIADFLDSELKTLDSVKASQEKLIELLIERRLAAIQSEIQASANLPDSNISPLKWHAKLRTGGTPANAQYTAETADGVPWLRPDDLDELGNPSRGTRFFDKSSLTGIATAVPGSVLLCCIGATLGKAGIVLENVAFNQQITSITSPLNSRYLHYYLVAKRQELKNLSMGNTLPILNNDRLGTLQIVIPTAENQARIVHQLDELTSSMDTAIQKSRELITAFTERRQALISAAVTGKIDVRGKN